MRKPAWKRSMLRDPITHEVRVTLTSGRVVRLSALSLKSARWAAQSARTNYREARVEIRKFVRPDFPPVTL